MAGSIGATLFFTDHSSTSGWSETHYSISAQDLQNALSQAQEMGKARAMLLGDNITLDYIRVSDMNVKNDSQVEPGLVPVQKFPITYNKELSLANAQQGANSGESGGADNSFVAALIRMEMGTTQRKSLYLRGCPDVNVKDGSVIDDPIWLKYFAKWSTLMRLTWGARVLDKSQATNPTLKIVNVVNNPNPPGGVTITLNAPPTFVVGDKVRVSGVKYQPAPAPTSDPINGLWQIASITGNNITLAGFAGQVYYLAGGTVQARKYVVQSYTSCQPIRITSRKSGRPFGQRPGRRKTRKAYH